MYCEILMLHLISCAVGLLIWHHRRAKQRIEDDDSGASSTACCPCAALKMCAHSPLQWQLRV
jgi:hypothetical protein